MTKDATLFVAMPLSELLDLIEAKVINAVGRYHNNRVKEKEPEKLLSITEAGLLLKVSKVTIHKWKKLKLIKSYRIGRRVYFKQTEVIGAMK